MAKVLKQTRLDSDLVEKIMDIAENENDGNFTATVESLLTQSITMRGLPEQFKLDMYSTVKRSGYMMDLDEREYISMTARIASALHI